MQRTKMKSTILTLALISIGLFCRAQDVNRMMKIPDNKHHHHFSFKQADNELTISLTALFILYKTMLSSQDGSSCTFTPSCSEYALQAMNTKGIIIGTFLTFDRLTRCNGLNPTQYPYDNKKHLFIDPVQ